jgi:hypothetical protein
MGRHAAGGGSFVCGVWCPGLHQLATRPASAPVRATHRRVAGGVDRPASAPAHIHAAQTLDADVGELPAADFPQPDAHLPHSITAAWLTSLLYRTGALAPDSGVIVAQIAKVTDIYGGTGVVYRIEVLYGGPRRVRIDDLPSSFVLKLYDSDQLLPNAQRELQFYSSLAARTPIRTPKCYWSKMKPRCGAQSRCAPEVWPTMEEFICSPDWCALQDEPLNMSESDISDMNSSSMTESSWGASEAWNPESPRARPSIALRYTKTLRTVGITKVGQLIKLHKYAAFLRTKGIKQKHLEVMLDKRIQFVSRSVQAVLLLEDVQLERASTVPCDGSPASIWIHDAGLVVEQIAKVHAQWWQSPEIPRLLGPARAYNSNVAENCWDRLEELWPTLSKYVYKFKKLRRRFPEPASVRQLMDSPMTLQHGDLHPANLTLPDMECGLGVKQRGAALAIFDWAEVNVCSGPEELAHFLLRSRVWSEGDAAGDAEEGDPPRLCAPKEIARPLLERYYRSLTHRKSPVTAEQYTYGQMLEHVCLGLLTSSMKLVIKLEEMRVAHIERRPMQHTKLGPRAVQFGAPRWLLEALRTNLSLCNLLTPVEP